jgi:hypothetical protein
MHCFDHTQQVSGWHGVPPRHHDLIARELPHAAVDRPHTQKQREAQAQLQDRITKGSDLGSNSPSVTTHRVSRYVLLVESYEVLEASSTSSEVQAGAPEGVQGPIQGLARRMALNSTATRGAFRTLQVRRKGGPHTWRLAVSLESCLHHSNTWNHVPRAANGLEATCPTSLSLPTMSLMHQDSVG